jgi:hypothetical protein
MTGAEETGITFRTEETGKYQIEIESGAYSPFPDGSGQWRTVVFIYHNKTVQRGDAGYGPNTPSNPTYKLGCPPDFSKKEEAEECPKLYSDRKVLEVSLQKGDTLILMPIDQFGAYSRNQGNLKLVIKLIT